MQAACATEPARGDKSVFLETLAVWEGMKYHEVCYLAQRFLPVRLC
jgi:hypothetical protein